MRRTVLAVATMAMAAAAAGGASAQALVADLSSHEVAISSSYAGVDLVLFGARKEAGDVIVILRGPPRDVLVRRKARVAGLWVNVESVTFPDVPGLYGVAASAPLEEIASEALLREHQIGVDRLALRGDEGAPEAELATFAAALVRNLQREGLYGMATGPVRFIAGGLFRSDFRLPSAAPIGTYTATTYLVRAGAVASVDTTTLLVTKTGLGRAVYDYAHEQPAAYGILAVLLALLAGWSAALIFRRS